jgi:hypothetical protein
MGDARLFRDVRMVAAPATAPILSMVLLLRLPLFFCLLSFFLRLADFGMALLSGKGQVFLLLGAVTAEDCEKEGQKSMAISTAWTRSGRERGGVPCVWSVSLIHMLRRGNSQPTNGQSRHFHAGIYTCSVLNRIENDKNSFFPSHISQKTFTMVRLEKGKANPGERDA